MKPTILLYNPPAADNEKDWLRPFPLNLLSICSLIDHDKYEIKIVQEFPDKAFQILEEYINRAICLGISSMTGTQIKNALLLAQKAKQARANLPIVWGGYHPTSIPEQTLQNDLVDIVVRGYGEIAFSQLVECFANCKSWENIKGISYIKNGEVVNNPESEIPKLNDLPPIPYHLFEVEDHFRKTQNRTLHYISSRGCPHQCGFCADFVIYKRKWNALSSERILNDLEYLKKKYKYDSVRFYDSNLFVNEQRTKEICQGVIEKKLNFKWLRCNGDAFILSRYSHSTLDLMKKSGVSNILLGVESGYSPALECINKTAGIKENLEAKHRLYSVGISVGFSFMFGFPYDLPAGKLENEHKKEIVATMKTIGEFSENYIPGDYYLLFLFTPYPGVRLFERYKMLGYTPPDKLEDWGTVNLNETGSAPWISEDMIKVYKNCLRLNWVFMHKISRNFFRNTKNNFLKRQGLKLDKLCRKAIRNRVNKGKLAVPFYVVAIQTYYAVKNTISKNGFKYFIKKIIKVFK